MLSVVDRKTNVDEGDVMKRDFQVVVSISKAGSD